MLKRAFVVIGALLLFVSFVTFQLPQAPDAHSQAALSAPFVSGHDVIVTQNPEETVYWKQELIRLANQSIEFSTGFAGGPLLEDTLLLLDSVMSDKPQLVVHLFIASCPLLSWADERKIEIFAERHPERFHCQIRGMSALRQGWGLVTSENHIKMLIVDEKYMVIGGTNQFHSYCRSCVPEDLQYEGLVDYFAPKACIDMDLVAKGPTITRMRQQFFDLWALYESGASLKEKSQFVPDATRYFAIDPNASTEISSFETDVRLVRNVAMKAIVSGPRFCPGACSTEYAALVKKSQKSIDLMHMYMSPVDEVYDSLMDATSRGVELNLVTNGPKDPVPIVTRTFGSYNMTWMLPLYLGSRFRLGERDIADSCTAKNCNVYVYEARDTLYHKKVMLVDDQIFVIGSYNLGYKSHYGDYEAIIEIDSLAVAAQVKHIMAADCRKSRKCDRAELSNWYFDLGPRVLALLQSTLLLGPIY